MSISKKQAVAIAIKEGKQYRDKLANTMLFILYRDKEDNQLKYIEIEFHPDKFQHLTGMLLTETNEDTGERFIRQFTALEFYNRCIGMPYITESEIEFKDEKTIDLKLMALPYITQITKITKMSGEFNHNRPSLEADFIIGGTKACIGISRYEDRNTYFPRSCLNEDIKKITTYTSQVLAIFQKPLSDKDELYKKIRYVAKGANLSRINFPQNIMEKVSLEEYIPPKTDIKKQIEKQIKNDPLSQYLISKQKEKEENVEKSKTDYDKDE